MVSVPARREQVTYAVRRGVSQRRACTLMKVARSALGYRSRLGVKDAQVVTRMVALSGQYPRYGYRRIRIFLGRDGHAMSAGRAKPMASAARPARGWSSWICGRVWSPNHTTEPRIRR